MYQRRNKMNPLWNHLLVAGFKEGKPFLGSVDLIGTAYEDEFLATGFGSYLAIPILRKKWHADMEEGEARELLEECLRVLFYRDCRALNRIRIAKATAEGTIISMSRVRFFLNINLFVHLDRSSLHVGNFLGCCFLQNREGRTSRRRRLVIIVPYHPCDGAGLALV
jgi:hypothetical protein